MIGELFAILAFLTIGLLYTISISRVYAILMSGEARAATAFLDIMGRRQVGKAHGFGPCIRGFESLRPSHARTRPFGRVFAWLC